MSGSVVKKQWDPWKMFDVSDKEKKAIEERAKIRLDLKREWQKKITNPYRGGEGGYVFDPAIQRLNSTRVTQWDHFKISPKTTWYGLALVVIPVGLLTYLVFKDRHERETKIRNGEVAYKDRTFKFMY
ncbi:hypothetical protein ScPMuIL_012769 [Solemya velum]